MKYVKKNIWLRSAKNCVLQKKLGLHIFDKIYIGKIEKLYHELIKNSVE